MLNFCTGGAQPHGDHVEAAGHIGRSEVLDIVLSGPRQTLPLGAIYPLFGAGRTLAGLYLDKNQLVPFFGHQVDLAPSGAIAARPNPIAPFFQISRRRRFTPPPDIP